MIQIERNAAGELMRITTPKWFDAHVHLRHGEMLKLVLPHTVKYCARAIVMPNLKRREGDPGILTGAEALAYRDEIKRAPGGESFEPLMTIKITDDTTPAMIREARQAGVIAGKAYPVGATTNSNMGVSDFKRLYPVFHEMEEQDMVLCLHGEDPSVPALRRERKFLSGILEPLLRECRRLRIVLEHVSSRAGVDFMFLHSWTRFAATVAIPHLFLTLDNIIGGKLQPHHFCKPIPKTDDDRTSIQAVALGGFPGFFLGTDSAPHRSDRKECAEGEAGVFSAPVAFSLLIELFERHRKLELLPNFTSGYACTFYGLPSVTETVTFVKKPWTVPDRYGDVVPFMAGQTLDWQVE